VRSGHGIPVNAGMMDEGASGKPFLIVTGSSAGGIDALLSLAAGLPADFPVPIVIAQHLDPSHPSRLDAILAHRTPLRVRFVAEREDLAAGGIYVVPAGHDVVIVDGAATSYVEVRQGPKPSVDRLFESAAETYGDGAIAIVFSGMGHDGLAGVRTVKERGGTVLIQDPRTASHPSMPLAIPPTLVDFVARPEEMGGILVDLIRGTLLAEGGGDQNELRRLLTQLRDRSGIDFLQYKLPTIMRRLSRLMVATGVSSIAEYIRYLQSHPEAYQKLVGAFLIKVTEFFRDAALFEELKNHILPELIDEAARSGNELRIWSAGTSTGEEAYSVAILCAELLQEKNASVGVRIFATDLDEEAIAFARRGIYGRETLRHVPAAWIERYFVRMGDQYEVGKRIRNMTVFGAHDLGQRAPFPRIDLCTCRNVLIYFTRELQTRALQLFAFSLRNGGYLVLGKAESTTLLSQHFRPVSETLKIYQRQGDRILIPPMRIRDGGSALAEREVGSGRLPLVPSAFRPSDHRPSLNELIGSLVANSPLGVVVVNRRYDIVSINAAARSLLDIHGVGVGEDLVHLVRHVDAGALRDVIDSAFHSEDLPAKLLPTADGTSETERWLRIAAYADRDAAISTMDAIVLIVTDVTTEVVTGRELEATARDRGAKVDQLSSRVDELSARQRALLRANDELTAANAELRSVNEQLLINAEEAASANEEIETLNEEMQATNEELETLNEELQATVEELNTTNEELEARGHDLERLGVTREGSLLQLETEHRALNAAMRALAGPVAVLDSGGQVLFASDGLLEITGAAPKRWWEHDGALSANGRSLPYTAQDVLVEGQRYRVVTFARPA
jgi:two-component system, chemotaxis family, CheB/CheR fusion protein